MSARRPRGGWDQGPDLFAVSGSPQARLRLSARQWPPGTAFPVNHARATVGTGVRADLARSPHPLLVTGFASIARLIEFVADRPVEVHGQVRLLLGTEPFTTQRVTFGSTTATFDTEVRRYWIEEQGVSLLLSAKIVQTLQALEAGRLSVRFVPGHDRLHAKIYVGDRAATLGSSNFTDPGLRTQLEANARFDRVEEPDRYAAVVQVAQNYWDIGEPWDAEFAALLRDMLAFVDWREALARACADLLEGQWAARYLASLPGSEPLWPSQISGIAEALWVVDNVGSVLVADATGSGKTRMGAHLTRAVRDRLWSTGSVRRDLTVLVCPPAVETQWLQESAACGLTVRTVSHGLLSRASAFGPRVQEREVADAQILAVDEAHNFLATGSRRTQFVRESTADHVLMFTATPINRGAEDLLSLVDLLGADNFDDATLRVLDNLGRRGHTPVLTEDERERLRGEIQRFTVRRTKTTLNAMVDADPEAYRDPATGRVCRYPQHRARTYPTGESEDDTDLAIQIRERAATLTGVALLGARLAVPPSLRHEYTDAQWLDLRLGAARGLAGHHVLSALRSSRAALLEHLRGTQAAVTRLAIAHLTKPQPTGDQIGAVHRVLTRGRPAVELACDLPAWLTDDDAWATTCRADLAAYEAIEQFTAALHGSRERTKADLIRRLAARHDRVLAFDHHPITLAVFKDLLDLPDRPVLIASGAETHNRRTVTRLFAPGSTTNGVALCSDAMNEGINLQGASCIVHLDLPTTLRVAEQRVGRVDRMNSPHDAVDVYWPTDGPAFATHANELLAAREAESAALLGSNLPIPASALCADRIVDHRTFTRTDTDQAASWDGLRDALDPVRLLVHGKQALVSPGVYDQQRHADHRVMVRVSPIQTTRPWAFFAVAGTRHGAPRWLLVEGAQVTTTAGLQSVTDRLRFLLAEDPPRRDFDHACQDWLSTFITAATAAEISLLPRRDQRALAQMRLSSLAWAAAARGRGDFDTAERWQAIADLTRPDVDNDGAANPHQAAAVWLDLTKHRRDAYRLAHRRHRYVTLSHIDADLSANPLDLALVEDALTGVSLQPPLDRRISACILGVPAPAVKP